MHLYFGYVRTMFLFLSGSFICAYSSSMARTLDSSISVACTIRPHTSVFLYLGLYLYSTPAAARPMYNMIYIYSEMGSDRLRDILAMSTRRRHLANVHHHRRRHLANVHHRRLDIHRHHDECSIHFVLKDDIICPISFTKKIKSLPLKQSI